MMSTTTRKMDLPVQARFAPVSSVNPDARTVDVIWTTGATVRRASMALGIYDETLRVTPDAVDLTRLNSGAPVLDTHGALNGLATTRDQVGVVERAWIEDGKGHATIRFPREGIDPAADRMFGMVQDKIVRSLSTGYHPLRARLEPGVDAESPDHMIVERWMPTEISFVPVPADAGAQTRAYDPKLYPVEIEIRADTAAGASPAFHSSGRSKERSMTESVSAGAETPEHRALAPTEARAWTPESTIDYLETVERTFPDCLPEARSLIKRGVSPGEVSRSLLQLAGDRQRAQGVTFSHHRAGESDNAHAAQHIQEALFARMSENTPTDGARHFMNYSLEDMGKNRLAARGERVTGLSSSEIFTRMMTTSDFPTLLNGAASQTLQAAYAIAQSGMKVVCRQSTVRDFKPKQLVSLAPFPILPIVLEAGEIKNVSTKDFGESYSVQTYGEIVSLSRQAIINDHLGGFADTLKKLGTAAAETEAMLLTATLLVNPIMADTFALFSTQHANLAASGAAISSTTLSAARLAMRTQTARDGKTLAPVVPKYLLTGPVNETAAELALSTVVPAQTANANPFAKLQLVIEPRITGTDWYLFADPAITPAIEYSYLEGHNGPKLDQQDGWNVLGTEFRVYEDFGAGAIDFRGAYRNPGA